MINRMHRFTEDEKKFIREYAYGHTYLEITNQLNKQFNSGLSISQVASYLKRNNIKTGHTGQFEKGHVPANHRPVGSEFVNEDIHGNKYIYVKTAEPGVWRMKQVVVWENCYGYVPKGKNVIFLDGDSMNCEIENLTLVDQSINAVLNKKGLRTDYAEGTMAGINTARLILEISKAEKRWKKHE